MLKGVFQPHQSVPPCSLTPFCPTGSIFRGVWGILVGVPILAKYRSFPGKPSRRQFSLFFLPGGRFINTDRTRQPKLPGDQRHQIAPPFALFRRAEHWQCPVQALFGKAIPVIHRVTAHVALPPSQWLRRFSRQSRRAKSL